MTHLFRLGPSSMTMRAAARKSASRSGVSVPPGFSLMVVLPSASASTGSMPSAWKLMPRSKLVAARLEAAQTSAISPRARSSATSRLSVRDLPEPPSPCRKATSRLAGATKVAEATCRSGEACAGVGMPACRARWHSGVSPVRPHSATSACSGSPGSPSSSSRSQIARCAATSE